MSCCSSVTRSGLSSERKRYSVCVPLRRLRSFVCTMPRQFPGVTWTTFITRQRSFWCVMIMLARSWVAGISIGGLSSTRRAGPLHVRRIHAPRASRSGGRRADCRGRTQPTGEPARGVTDPRAAGGGTAAPGARHGAARGPRGEGAGLRAPHPTPEPGRFAQVHEPSHPGGQPLPPPACAPPRRLVPLGRGGVRARTARAPADFPERRLLDLPLVPRDGGGVVRRRGDRRRAEPPLRRHQG